MFTYKVPLEQVDKALNEHVDYLNTQYKLGNFQASGKKVPRTGGIILSTISSKSKLLEVIEKDPFNRMQFADYKITEFIASKTCEELTFLKNND
mgnify:CR=1 FL=1